MSISEVRLCGNDGVWSGGDGWCDGTTCVRSNGNCRFSGMSGKICAIGMTPEACGDGSSTALPSVKPIGVVSVTAGRSAAEEA